MHLAWNICTFRGYLIEQNFQYNMYPLNTPLIFISLNYFCDPILFKNDNPLIVRGLQPQGGTQLFFR